jgi:hypothetical protein
MIVPNPVADPRSLRTVAALMKADLQSRRLRVALGWPDVRTRTYNCPRVIDEENPRWYREFCAHHSPSKRTPRPRQRSKPDTIIKRHDRTRTSHTLRALDELAAGQAYVRCERHTVYAQRLLPFIERELKRLPLQNWMFE